MDRKILGMDGQPFGKLVVPKDGGKKAMRKIYACTPVTAQVPWQMSRLMTEIGGKPFFVEERPGEIAVIAGYAMSECSQVVEGRNACVRSLYEHHPDWDYALWIDSDMAGIAIAHVAALFAHNKDIVSGLYIGRTGQHSPTVRCYGGGYLPLLKAAAEKQRLLKVEGVGSGFCLVKRAVYDKAFIEYPDGKYWYFIGNEPDGRMVGEDISFCILAAEHGFETWLDVGVQIGHLGTFVWEPKQWFAAMAEVATREAEMAKAVNAVAEEKS